MDKLTAVRNFTSVKLAEVKFAPASYLQRWALGSNRPANVWVSVERVEVVVRS